MIGETVVCDASSQEAWEPMPRLRIKERENDNVLEQLWKSSDGRREWRMIPVVEGE